MAECLSVFDNQPVKTQLDWRVTNQPYDDRTIAKDFVGNLVVQQRNYITYFLKHLPIITGNAWVNHQYWSQYFRMAFEDHMAHIEAGITDCT